MTTPDGNDASEPAMRRRLVALADKFSQAEVARRTNVSPANVHRYLKSNRIPATFVAACAQGFNVNLDWLMRGEGPQFATDKVEDDGKMTEGLLEVVQALNVVEHVRLGALGHKKHLLMLRELRDAMARYDDLHKRLNKQGGPILRAVLRDLRNAMDKGNIDLAAELSNTAEQLGRFCDDAELAQDRAVLQAHFELMSGNLQQALKHVHSSIVVSLQRGGLFGQREFEATFEAVATLAAWSQFSQARRVAQAALALADDATAQSHTAFNLHAQIARMQLESGELREAIRTLTDVRGRLNNDAEGAAAVDAFMAKALLFAGSIDVRTAIEMGADSQVKAALVLGFALFTEDRDELERSIKYWDLMTKGRSRSKESQLRSAASLLLRALGGKTAGLVGEVRRFVARQPGQLSPFTHGPILGCRLYRALDRAVDARSCFKDSERMLASVPDDRSVIVLPRARHMRSALEFGNAAQKHAAHEFFRQHVDLGYHCFAQFVEGASS